MYNSTGKTPQTKCKYEMKTNEELKERKRALHAAKHTVDHKQRQEDKEYKQLLIDNEIIRYDSYNQIIPAYYYDKFLEVNGKEIF